MRLLRKGHILLAHLIFISIAACFFKSALAKHSYQSPHPHLEPMIQDLLKLSGLDWQSILPTVRGILRENSDLIKSLQESEIHSDFLPYIAKYEALKGSPINPNIRIFFYDSSRLPLSHIHQINTSRGACFSGLIFVFINIRYWSTTNSRIILDKQTHHLILDSYASGDILLSNTSPRWHLDGNAYRKMSYEERNFYKQESIMLEKQREERLSDMQKFARRDFLRHIDLFHELGHCDLNRGHEDHNDSIMGKRFLYHISEVISEGYPHIDLDDLIGEFFSKRDTRYTIYDVGWFTSIMNRFRNNSNELKLIDNLRRSLQDLNDLNSVRVTDSERTTN